MIYGKQKPAAPPIDALTWQDYCTSDDWVFLYKAIELVKENCLARREAAARARAEVRKSGT
jgi:hypothetical protein